jgi:hypothetical protein
MSVRTEGVCDGGLLGGDGQGGLHVQVDRQALAVNLEVRTATV